MARLGITFILHAGPIAPMTMVAATKLFSGESEFITDWLFQIALVMSGRREILT
ncbi:MAG: hypothetical protein MK214_10715 [Thalassotalea sp.]|nr:hypothetical protein [Thalassotalea sp.]